MTELQQKVIHMTGISQEQYNQIVFDLGIAYAEFYTDRDSFGVRCLTSTKSFWTWFKIQFNIIDKAFVDAYLVKNTDKAMQQAMFELWLKEHRAEMLTAYPSRVVTEEYALVVAQVIDETHRKEVAA